MNTERSSSAKFKYMHICGQRCDWPAGTAQGLRRPDQAAAVALPTALDAPSRSQAKAPKQLTVRVTGQAPSPALNWLANLAASLRFPEVFLETTFPRVSCCAYFFPAD